MEPRRRPVDRPLTRAVASLGNSLATPGFCDDDCRSTTCRPAGSACVACRARRGRGKSSRCASTRALLLRMDRGGPCALGRQPRQSRPSLSGSACRAYSSFNFVGGAPDDFICFGSHRHPWRDGIIRLASFVALCPLLYALIMTPEALRQEKATRRGRWRLIVRPRHLYGALPRRHWVALWCGYTPAFLFSYVASPHLLEWLFPPVGTFTMALYVSACGLVTVVGWRVWTRKRQQGEQAASQQLSTPHASPR